MKLNGKFTVDEFIEINCSVILRDVSLSFYVISFIKVNYNIKCDIF